MSENPLFTSFSVFYYSTLTINVTHSTWLGLMKLMSVANFYSIYAWEQVNGFFGHF